MKVLSSFSEDSRVKGVPYPSEIRADAMNAGFVNLKGQPELVEVITEANGVSGLKRLLRLFATPKSPFFSVGCDSGTWKQDDGRYAGSCYIEFSFNYSILANRQNYHSIHQAFEGRLISAKVDGLVLFDWRVAPIEVPWIQAGMSSCSIWARVESLRDKTSALKACGKSMDMLADFFENLDVPHGTKGQVFRTA